MKLILKQRPSNIKERKKNILILNLLQRLMQVCIGEGINTQVKVVKAAVVLERGSINRMKRYQENLKKIKPPMFNGEVENGEEAEAWLLGMKKYFHIYNYSDRMKSWMAIYNLTRKDDIW